MESIGGSKFVRGAQSIGLEITGRSGNELIATCPSCDKDKHFYLNAAKGLYHCKACDASGNYLQLLELLYEQAVEDCNDTDRVRLAQDRGLPMGAFAHLELGYIDGKYLIPVRNLDGKLTDIRQYQLGQKSKSTAGCAVGLFGAQFLAESARKEEPVYVCEGEWDAIAFEWLRLKAGKPGIVVGVPGANTFKPEWAAWLRDRDVFALYDNDDAGRAGHRKLCQNVDRVVRSLHVHRWPEGSGEGRDVRDLVAEALAKHEA